MRRTFLTLILTFLITSIVFGNPISIGTYHHSPKGIYNKLTLTPRSQIGDSECNDNTRGLLYVDKDNGNALKICQSDGWGPIPGVWTQSSTNPTLIYPSENIDDATAQLFLGIGSTAPIYKLTLDNDGGILAQGEFGLGDTLADLGDGTRLIWYPKKGAFRAGQIETVSSVNDFWDKENIGDYSLAAGYNTEAGNYVYSDNDYQTAFGNSTIASGQASFASGLETLAEGDYSVAMGRRSYAEGYASTAIGGCKGDPCTTGTDDYRTHAQGDYSLALGIGTIAPHYHSIAMGKYNYYEDIPDPDDNPDLEGGSLILAKTFWDDVWTKEKSWAPYNEVFSVGDGSDNLNRSNLFTILAWGSMSIGPRPLPFLVSLDVNGEAEMGAINLGRDPPGGEDITEEPGMVLGRYNDETLGPDILMEDNGVIAAEASIYLNTVGYSNDPDIYFGANYSNSTGVNSSNILMRIHADTDKHDGIIGIGTTDVNTWDALYLANASGAKVPWQTGVWTDGTSSVDQKENITPLSYSEAIKAVKEMNPVVYSYKSDKKKEKYVGFIAEYVPELIATEKRNGIIPMDVTAVLTKVVQFQKNELEKQEELIRNQQKELEEISYLLNRL